MQVHVSLVSKCSTLSLTRRLCLHLGKFQEESGLRDFLESHDYLSIQVCKCIFQWLDHTHQHWRAYNHTDTNSQYHKVLDYKASHNDVLCIRPDIYTLLKKQKGWCVIPKENYIFIVLYLLNIIMIHNFILQLWYWFDIRNSYLKLRPRMT